MFDATTRGGSTMLATEPGRYAASGKVSPPNGAITQRAIHRPQRDRGIEYECCKQHRDRQGEPHEQDNDQRGFHTMAPPQDGWSATVGRQTEMNEDGIAPSRRGTFTERK